MLSERLRLAIYFGHADNSPNISGSREITSRSGGIPLTFISLLFSDRLAFLHFVDSETDRSFSMEDPALDSSMVLRGFLL
ncbi:hypothetical protein RJ60_13495 [Mesotoga sp. B105.6.4]|nr:hypothetical protein RJ60_13495 [Mesotoga sp. B105.6.4]